ncbi:MAG: stage V sporulation protein AB [bacterium]|nr:stage V sporulation protein AB [bacterium]
MTLIKGAFLLGIGFSGGVIVAAGLYAFITLLQVVQRLAARTGTANQIDFYEDSIMVGGILGNLVSIFEFRIPFTILFLTIYGFFSGIFVGCFAIALAEVIDVFPAISRRISIKMGVSFLVLCIALGKGVGAFYQLVVNRG